MATAAIACAPQDAPITDETFHGVATNVRAGFAFFTPLSQTMPVLQGPFEPNAYTHLSMNIDELAPSGQVTRRLRTFTPSTTPRLLSSAREEGFGAQWFCGSETYVDGSTYRVSVLADGRLLGYSDIGPEMINYLRARPDLWIKFRVELRDADLDAVANWADNCVHVANPDQLDRDHDLIGDNCNAQGEHLLPQLSAIDPARVQAEGGAFTMTINGSGFAPSTRVSVAGANVETTYRSPEQLTAAIPASSIAHAGEFAVVATNPAPGGGASIAQTLTVYHLTPVLASISPEQVTAGSAAFTLTVSGSSFAPASEIVVGGRALPTTFVSSSEARALVPAELALAATTLLVRVQNGAAQSAGSQSLTINNPAPQLASFTPAGVTAGAAGFTLAITGSSFVQGAVVTFNASALATTFISASELRANVPASLVNAGGYATLLVTNPSPHLGASATRTFTIHFAAPAITSLSPASVPAGSNSITLAINGTGFRSGLSAQLGDDLLATTFVSATRATAIVPASLLALFGPDGVVVANVAPSAGPSEVALFTIAAPSCTDNVRNGGESDLDCGGSCTACATGRACALGSDCASSVCASNICQAPACHDGVKNGTESDVDCGGASCSTCTTGQVCAAASDCGSGLCTNNTCAPLAACTSGKVVFNATGAAQTFQVTNTCASVSVKLWGAGGGGYCFSGNGGCQQGGAGGYAGGTLAVTGGESLTVIVGGAGVGGENNVLKAGGFGGGGTTGTIGFAGSGGGRSAIRRGTTELVTAGGGGGAGASNGGVAGAATGGAGGGLTGQNGGGTRQGLGGTQTAGGTGAGGNGAQFLGGQAVGGDNGGGGSGGGGYFGGGAGSNTNDGEGGGGGGSSYLGGVTSAVTIAGTNAAAGNASDFDMIAGRARGGAAANASAGDGGAGMVVISWGPPTALAYASTAYSFPEQVAIGTPVAPSYTGAALTSCSVAPALPAGLSLSTSCAISGTPTGAQAPATYTITASNALGSTSATLSIAIVSGCASGRQAFSSTGAAQTFTVPANCGTISAKMWGAGGGGYCWSGNNSCQAGGAGGYTTGNITVAPGELLSVIVGGAGLGGENGTAHVGGYGGGGASGTSGFGGSGGGRSAIRRGATELGTAGGGGGAGASNGGTVSASSGGAGGGLTGQAGGNLRNGLGGTQTAGGAGAGGNGAAFAGASVTGGDGGGGGGGGGGYFGGGAGSSTNDGEGGGGGGSSYIGGMLNGATTAGNLTATAGTTDPDYVAGIGLGGPGSIANYGNGGAGRVVLSWGPPSALTYSSSALAVSTGGPANLAAPTYNGLMLTSCASSPALPAGLSLSSTCQIVGTPSAVSPVATYTITGQNAIGATSATITLSVVNTCLAGRTTFASIGAVQTFTVPPQCTTVTVKLWGAGGGGYCFNGCAVGGAGGFASGSLAVTPNETLNVLVGAQGLGGVNGLFKPTTFGGGGASGGVGYGGTGGGRSAIRRGTLELVTAGGGGGAGSSNGAAASSARGGAGGGTTGQAGGSIQNGLGGTQVAGGTGPGGSGGQFYGAQPVGGDSGGGGSGGGGYFGGGAGSNANAGEGGGGGGSSYLGGLISGTTTGGAAAVPGGNTDADYAANTAIGGAGATGAAGDGTAGRVVISWGP